MIYGRARCYDMTHWLGTSEVHFLRRHMAKSDSIHDMTLRNVEVVAEIEKAFHNQRSSGDRVADTVAFTVGSWTFIIVQTVVLLLWMGFNLLGWALQWDPYPFILLNLVMSFQAAFASPIIMMSQNRQARLSDRRNQLDLQINLLAEQENTEMLKLLRLLCEKQGIHVDAQPNASTSELEQPIRLDEVVRQIIGTNEPKNDNTP
jgi:uncharacterized membrane protein